MGEEPRVGEEERAMTPAARVALVWEITKNVWAFKEPGWRESRLRRDVVRVIGSRR
jgi:hypothetical protein